MRPLKTLPKFENHFARMIVRFHAQLEADGCFSAQKVPSLHSVANRTSYPTLSFYQSFHHFFLQAAESSPFSEFFVDTTQFLW